MTEEVAAVIPAWVVGITLSLVACFVDSLSINVQRLAHKRIGDAKAVVQPGPADMMTSGEEQSWRLKWTSWCGGAKKNAEGEATVVLSHGHHGVPLGSEPPVLTGHAEKRRVPLSSQYYVLHPLWVVGILLAGVGGSLNVISYNFASVSLLAPMGAVTTGVNMGVAPLLFGEGLDMRTAVCTVMILLGTSCALAFGPKHDEKLTLSELIDRFLQPTYVVYMICFFSLTAVVLAALTIYNREARRRKYDMEKYQGLVTRFLMLIYPALAGAMGSFSVMFVKSAVEVVFSGNGSMSQLGTYILIVASVVCVFMQVRLLNKGLMKAPAILVLPTYQALWVTGNVVNGMVFFQDYLNMSHRQLALFVLFNGLTLTAVFALSWASRDRESCSESGDEGSRTERGDWVIELRVQGDDKERSRSENDGYVGMAEVMG